MRQTRLSLRLGSAPKVILSFFDQPRFDFRLARSIVEHMHKGTQHAVILVGGLRSARNAKEVPFHEYLPELFL